MIDPTMSTPPRSWTAAASLAATLLLLHCGPIDDQGLLRSSGKLSDRFPNIRLWDQHNESVRFYDNLVKDRIVIINFMYSTCTER